MSNGLGLVIGMIIGTIAGYALCSLMVVSKKDAERVFWEEWNNRNYDR